MNITVFESQVQDARTYLILVFPFFAHLAWHLRVIPCPGIGTAAVTPRGEALINPGFFASCDTPQQRAFILAHEVLHVALGIFWRGKGHDPLLSNAAHDYVVNSILAKEKSDWVRADCLLDQRFQDASYEEVYVTLAAAAARKVSMEKRAGAGKVGAAGALDGDVQWGAAAADSGSDTREAEESFARWRMRMTEAAESARSVGRFPSHLQRLVDEATAARVPWQEKLRMAMSDVMARARTDWSWPSRRASALGLYLPREEHLGLDLAVYVDSSGSVGRKQLGVAVAEIREIILQSGGRIRWLTGDAAIHSDEWVGSGDVLKIKGGGGTSFLPLFRHVETCPPRGLVVFTDTWGEMPEAAPAYPVVWAVYEHALKDARVPFGEIVAIPSA
ncbi:MAG: hypothetical protein HY360_14560 [Verrucomicrobia bacterium]|nr:hypothetical protein [Verrucomicrobiota bacterium]